MNNPVPIWKNCFSELIQMVSVAPIEVEFIGCY
jgi:hypothetical protein